MHCSCNQRGYFPLRISTAECGEDKSAPGNAMMIAGIAYLVCAAVFLEACYRAPAIDTI